MRWNSNLKAVGALLAGLCACGVLACRPEVPAQFVEHSQLAQDAAIRGDHLEASRQWELASRHADLEHVRDEAIYRQATNLERAGHHAEAQSILRSLVAKPGSRQERAAYDLATEALLGTPSDGGKQLEATLVEFPGAGVARGALDRWLRRLTPQERLVLLERLARSVSEATLSERLLLQRARTLELLGRLPEAFEDYSRLIRTYPYPSGQYWDEAMLYKASLEARTGRRAEAIATLREMLSYRETATIVGTYERRYAVATLILARFLAFDDWQNAHELLRDFPDRHPTSRELDDALWAAALLARDNGASALACEDIEAIHEVDADSRYAACAVVVCPDHKRKVTSKHTCADYVARSRADFETVVQRAAAPYYSGVNEQHRSPEGEQNAVPPQGQ